MKEFKRNLERYSGGKFNNPKDWFEAFNMLRDYLDTLNQKKVVVFLDELPWMDTPKAKGISWEHSENSGMTGDRQKPGSSCMCAEVLPRG